MTPAELRRLAEEQPDPAFWLRSEQVLVATSLPALLACVEALEHLCTRIEEGDWERARAALDALSRREDDIDRHLAEDWPEYGPEEYGDQRDSVSQGWLGP